jgi:hypothetical protein
MDDSAKALVVGGLPVPSSRAQQPHPQDGTAPLLGPGVLAGLGGFLGGGLLLHRDDLAGDGIHLNFGDAAPPF